MDDNGAPQVEVPEPQTGVLTNYRITRILIAIESATVVAGSEAEAVKRVEEGSGRHAGSEGPITFAALVQDRSGLSPAPTLQQIGRELGTAWSLLKQTQAQLAARRANFPPPPS